MEKGRIMYIPLDERPCNYEFPRMIIDISDIDMIRPPKEILGCKKKPADVDILWEWMRQNIEGITHLVVSIDMLVYGGIVPSRIHQKQVEECLRRLLRLRELKKANNNLKIFAFNLIMRTPSYNSSEEEPDYYEEFGERIFHYGVLSDKIEQNIALEEEFKKFNTIKEHIPQKILEDYLARREINHKVNLHTVNLVKEGIIDFLIIPMDDCSKYGFSARERRKIMKYIDELDLTDRIYSYPGADEVGCTLTARAFNDIKGTKPAVFTRYSSESGKTIIPLLEDRSLSETVKYQIIAAGGITVYNSAESDFVLMVNPPSEITQKISDSWNSYLNRGDIGDPERNLNEFVEALNCYINKGKNCAVADVAFLNGADNSLMKLIRKYGLLKKLLSYGGWNTSSNTLGTVIAHSMIVSFYINRNTLTEEQKEKSNMFLFLRYLEDWGYQYSVRTKVTQQLDKYEVSYYNLADKEEAISEVVKTELEKFKKENLGEFNYNIEVYMPWNRMFEVGIRLKESNL
ncbi:MAG TPA: DUF4127 family protein [Clostridia bacterium]|nr:DUF4127 family protein [Clostridia bacterium]